MNINSSNNDPINLNLTGEQSNQSIKKESKNNPLTIKKDAVEDKIINKPLLSDDEKELAQKMLHDYKTMYRSIVPKTTQEQMTKEQYERLQRLNGPL